MATIAPVIAAAQNPAALADRLAGLPWVAGIAVAGAYDGRVDVVAGGVADVDTGRLVEPETRFRPGSITKLLTATLVLRCVDDGLAALDDPVQRWLPTTVKVQFCRVSTLIPRSAANLV